MRMEGPYDYVPPNYWYNNEALLGAAAGFGSELGAGVGTPEKGSLDTFLSTADLSDLWKQPEKGLYHMSTDISSFYTRSIYNEALWARYGAPSSLDDYLLKSQMMDYEATRAQFEAYLSRWNAERPATGLIYWMLNNAWPSLHWNLFDYYLHPGGSYFGTKAATADREHALYDYLENTIYLVNRYVSGPKQPSARTIDIEVLSLAGKSLAKKTLAATTTPNSSQKLSTVPALPQKDVSLLRLTLRADGNKTPLSTSTYWLAPTLDQLDWDNSTWYHTPISRFASLAALADMQPATLRVRARRGRVELENTASVPAVFVRLNLVDKEGRDVVPVLWGENYLTLWPGEKKVVEVDARRAEGRGWRVEVSGRNVGGMEVKVEG
jgi:exo-1,4-beta-D-glucosaminidase